jgi:feruloyl-CoA synthase
MFAAMSIGVIASISPNRSLMSSGLARLQDIATLLQPSFVFVQDSETYSGGHQIRSLPPRNGSRQIMDLELSR